MSHVIVSSVARTTAVLTLLGLAFGLPQFLVICTPKAGSPHVEFTCSAGCQHGHAETVAMVIDGEDRDGTSSAVDDSDGCTHFALGVELGQPPTKYTFGVIDEIATDSVTLELCPRLDIRPSGAWALATGPPRPGRTIAVLRTTELQE